MTGARGVDSCCPLCGGRMQEGTATLPFVLEHTTVIVKDVPAEICQACHEACTSGAVTDRITDLLNRLQDLGMEVVVTSLAQVDSTRVLPAG